MKILMFGWEWPPLVTGDLGRATLGLVGGLLKKGVFVELVLPEQYGPGKNRHLTEPSRKTPSDAAMEKPTSSLQPMSWTPVPALSNHEWPTKEWLPEENPVSMLSKSGFSPNLYFMGSGADGLESQVNHFAERGAAYGQRANFDLIHAHDWMTFGAGANAKRVSGRPMVAHVHSTEFDRHGDQVDPEIYAIERDGLRLADKIVAVSAITKKTLVERYEVPEEKIVVLHSGVGALRETHPPINGQPFGESVVVFLGRITRQKGPQYFIEAANRLLKKGGNVRCGHALGLRTLRAHALRGPCPPRAGHHLQTIGGLRGAKRRTDCGLLGYQPDGPHHGSGASR